MRGFAEADPEAVLSDLDACAEWLREIGLDRPGARFTTYRRHLRQWLEADSTGSDTLTALSRRVGIDALANSILEATEWHGIYTALRGCSVDPDLRLKLREFVGGPVYSKNEKRNTGARNYQFELAFGAQLLRAGFDVQFGGDGDLWFPLRERRIFVECKRSQTAKRVAGRVEEAFKQLARRYRSAPDPRNCRGFIAISLTKVINPDQDRGLPAPGWSDLDLQLREVGRDLASHLERSCRTPSDPRTIGLASQFRCMAWIASQPRPHLCAAGNTSWGCLRPRYDLDWILWSEVTDKLGDSLPPGHGPR